MEEPYGGLRIVPEPETQNRRIKVGQYEFQKSSTSVPSPSGMVTGVLGSGVTYYKDGKYIGYHFLPDSIFRLPLEEIVKTAQFKAIIGKIESR